MLRTACAAAVAFAVLPSTAFAWGSSGHSIIAEIAQRRLTPAADAQLLQLIGNASLASFSSWADDYKFTPPGIVTKPWHFVDIPVGQAHYDAQRDCASGDGTAAAGSACLVAALDHEISILADNSAAKDDRIFALKMVVHLAGDLTQPFHCSEALDDGGGNAELIQVTLTGPGTTTQSYRAPLHKLWDEGLIEARVYDWGAYIDELEASVVPTIVVPPIEPDSVTRWADACHAVGEKLYAMMPTGWQDQLAAQKAETDYSKKVPISLPASYQAAVQPIVAAQLAMGGLQLAEILNEALGGP